MKNSLQEQNWTAPRIIALASGCYSLIVAAAAFIGWAADIHFLAAWEASGIAMQPNTALATMLSGVAIIALAFGRRDISVYLALPIGVIGAATLFEHITGTNLGIDTLLLFDREWGGVATQSPGRMGPPAAFSFSLISIALLLSGFYPKAERAAPPIGIMIIAVSMLSLIGYLFRATEMFSTPQLTAIAFQTATTFFATGIGLVASFPEYQPMRLILERSAAGMIMRRALPLIIVSPIIVGLLRVRGEQAGLYDATFGRALLILLLIGLLVTLLWYCVQVIRVHEQEQQKTQEALQISEERFSKFMRSLPGLAWIKDSQGRYIYANHAAVQAFRMPGEEALYGKSDGEIFPAEVAAEFQENDRKALDSETGMLFIETLKHEDGIVHHSIVSKFPILGTDNSVAMVGGVAIDVTDRIRAEEALREADRRKDEFLATLAHELRNPLAPIKNAIYLLESPDTKEEVKEEALQMMRRQVRLMKRLIDDLMDVSRVSQGKVELQKQLITLNDVIQGAVEIAKPLITEKRHELAINLLHQPVWLEGDSIRLSQVFANLLNNAAKYTSERGNIVLTVRKDETDDVVISVKDNGIGIPKAMLSSIFDLFVQVDNSLERMQGGLGIGLTLVKELVGLHGGSISAVSDGKGSEFIVRLPVAQKTEEEAAASQAISESNRSYRILVVDDNEPSAKTLGWTLELIGHEVELAHDSKSGIEKAKTYRPDIILLDIGLPGMNGYDLCKIFRKDHETKDAFIIAQTGWGQEEHRNRSKEAGFNHHLVKPIEMQTLQQLLESLITNNRG
jgi:PAS domain S-box-containing protein